MIAKLQAGTFVRIDAISKPTEVRTEFVRTAVDREIRKRERRLKRPGRKGLGGATLARDQVH